MRHLQFGIAAVGLAAPGIALEIGTAAQRQQPPEKHNMEPVGNHDLQGRERCKVAIQTHNVDVYDRGYI